MGKKCFRLNKCIFLICPATLLFALRTIATLWKREKQNANAMEIARRGGALYDKFVGFYEQLSNLGTCIKKHKSVMMIL